MRLQVGMLNPGGGRSASGASVVVTVAEFNAAMAAKAVNGVTDWTLTYAHTSGRRYTDAAVGWVPTNNSSSGSAWNSSLGSEVGFGPPAAFLVHAFPSRPAYDAQVDKGGRVYFQLAPSSDGPHGGASRNAFITATQSAAYGGVRIVDMIWLGADNIPYRSNPSIGGPVTVYTLGTP